MSEFERVLDEEMKETAIAIKNFHWEDPYVYALWLANTYEMVRYSIRLVAFSGAWTKLEDEYLLDRCVDHAVEERGHPKLCVLDVKNLGYDIKDLPVTYEASSLYQIQYYQILTNGAASFFGYSQGLEELGDRFGMEISSRVVGAHGKKSARFCLVHAEADQGHCEEARDCMKGLNTKQELAAIENLKICSEMYRSMLSKITENVGQIKLAG